jgi:curli biogenesis system outer membrane secretion channel CsgG
MKKILALYSSIASIALICLVSGCNKSTETAVPAAPAVPAPTDPTGIKKTLDVGKTEQVTTTAIGSGISPGAAVNAALKLAIMQINGATVDASSANLNVSETATATLDVESSRGNGYAQATATLQSQQFAELIVTQSKGVISSFKVLSTTPPASKGDLYKVEIEAKIAKFVAPADNGKLKIVVAPLRTNKATFNVGGRAVPSEEVLVTIHQQIVDALTQTGRFIVLDRQFEGEIQGELDMISSGQTPNTDFAKLGQAASADLIWVGVVNDFTYEKHVRRLEMSERDLVSYSGDWSVSQRMINLATRQILQSTTLKGNAPAQAPTTLGTNFNLVETVKNMSLEMVKKSTETILLKTFPITIVERDGNNVVLSQGGSAVAENSRYMIYQLGKEIKDPQTGLSLGNMENRCCEVVINRVTPNLSYGVLENVKIKLDGIQPGALQIRELISSKAVVAKLADETPAAAPATTGKPAGKASAKEKSPVAPAAEPKKKDDW